MLNSHRKFWWEVRTPDQRWSKTKTSIPEAFRETFDLPLVNFIIYTESLINIIDAELKKRYHSVRWNVLLGFFFLFPSWVWSPACMRLVESFNEAAGYLEVRIDFACTGEQRVKWRQGPVRMAAFHPRPRERQLSHPLALLVLADVTAFCWGKAKNWYAAMFNWILSVFPHLSPPIKLFNTVF